MSWEWAPGAGIAVLGLAGSFAAWLQGKAKQEGSTEAEQQALEDREEGTKQAILEFREEFRIGMAEMRTVSTSIARLESSQRVTNEVTARAIESIISRQDRIEEKVNDHGATLKLLTELATRDQTRRAGGGSD